MELLNPQHAAPNTSLRDLIERHLVPNLLSTLISLRTERTTVAGHKIRFWQPGSQAAALHSIPTGRVRFAQHGLRPLG